MKKITTLILVTLIGNLTFGQSIDPSVIAAGGDYVENGGIAVSYTIGQTVTATLENGDIVTQGFQQDNYTIVEIPEQSSEAFSVTIYPVPTTDEITIEFNSDFQGKAQMAIIDELGKTISQEELVNPVNKVSLGKLAESYYFLKINYQGNIKTYKIQKINH